MIKTMTQLFCPWMKSSREPGSHEYATEVHEMLAEKGLSSEITKDGDWYYVEPSKP